VPEDARPLSDRVMLGTAWTLSPGVELRPEPFGALAYHFGNRRLVFLRRPELVRVVRGLAAATDLEAALRAAQVPSSHWPAYVGALAKLAQADLIRPRQTAETTPSRSST
jgi:putative mycofactocin binding protein MftB